VVSVLLLEGGLAILTDHDERREEDRTERHDQRQRRPRALLEDEHPRREEQSVEMHEGHRAGERRDPVGDPELQVRCALLELGDDDWIVKDAGSSSGIVVLPPSVVSAANDEGVAPAAMVIDLGPSRRSKHHVIT